MRSQSTKEGALFRIKCESTKQIISELDADGEILEWDECLDDCPREEPEVICVDDPPYPILVNWTGLEVNFTTDFDPEDFNLFFEVKIAGPTIREPRCVGLLRVDGLGCTLRI